MISTLVDVLVPKFELEGGGCTLVDVLFPKFELEVSGMFP
jgi:hypothetical protein